MNWLFIWLRNWRFCLGNFVISGNLALPAGWRVLLREGRCSGLGRALSLLDGSGGWEKESLGEFPAGMCPAFLGGGGIHPAVHGGTMGGDLSGLEVDFHSQGRY